MLSLLCLAVMLPLPLAAALLPHSSEAQQQPLHLCVPLGQQQLPFLFSSSNSSLPCSSSSSLPAPALLSDARGHVAVQ